MDAPVNINGVEVAKLTATVDAIKANPALANFKFRIQTDWIQGAHTRTTIDGFYGAGAEDKSNRSFVLEGDEPPVLLGNNAGPNAVELALAGLASCLAVGFSYNAAAQGIRLDELRFRVEGDIDLHAFLGLTDKIRPGYQNIRVVYSVKSDAPQDKLMALCDYVQKTSPVMDIIRNPVPVSVVLES